jgi:hypothetical protein
MLLKIAAVLAAIPLALVGLFGATGILWVDVREGGAAGHHIVVPVPLLAVQAAAAFVPPHVTREMELPPEARQALPAAERALQALAEAPDGELVRVEDRGETVIVRKVGDTLEVRVSGPRENVKVNVPLDTALDVVRGLRDGRVHPAEIVGALREARFTDLVEVQDGDDRVRISVW